MAITVTDNRTEIDQADAITGWSSPVAGEGITLYTSLPTPKELSGHLGIGVSESEGEVLHTHSSVNMSSGILVYVWVLVAGLYDSKANYGISLVLGDGTNTNAYQVAGIDEAVFRHYTGQPAYQCLLLDTGSLPTGKALRGTFGNFDNTAVTEFGANYNVSSKALGGADNCWIDRIMYGNGGLTITVTDSANGWLYDLAAKDSSNVSVEAYGICRSLGGSIYGLQGQILLGDASGTGSDTLKMVDQTFKFENFSGVGTDKFGITVQGNSTGTSNIDFTNSILFCPSGVGAFFIATDTDVDDLDIVGCSFYNFIQGISLSTDATKGPNHDISNNKFVGCSQINIGKTAFKNNIIDSATDANGGMIIDSNTSLANVEGLSFISDGTGHAIYITATGSYTFKNFVYSGYGANETTDAVVYNNSGGAVTILVDGGDSPTYRNGAGASTTISLSASVDIEVVDSGDNPIVGARCFVEADSGGSYPSYEVVTSITAVGTTATVTHTAHGLFDGQLVCIRDATNSQYYNGIFTITYISVDSYSYTMSGSPPSPATGTITATFVLMSELTISGGLATESVKVVGTQPIQGHVRYQNPPEYYKEGSLSGDFGSDGFSVKITLVDDD